MSILVQLLLGIVFLSALYVVFLNHREKFHEVATLLPDFGKLIPNKQSAYVKMVIYVPDAHAETVRLAIGESGAGATGNYTFQSFSTQGIGRFRPEAGAHPSIGEVGKLELVEEERIEVTVPRQNLPKILEILKKVHPYEEAVVDIYSLEAAPEEVSVYGH